MNMNKMENYFVKNVIKNQEILNRLDQNVIVENLYIQLICIINQKLIERLNDYNIYVCIKIK